MNITGSFLADIYEKLIAIYSEAGVLDQAHQIALKNEDLLEKLLHKGISAAENHLDISQSDYRNLIISKIIITYLNHALVLSRMDRRRPAQIYLETADELVRKSPEAAALNSGITQRISFFKKHGLPASKNSGDSEKVYRAYKEKIETILRRNLQSKQESIEDLNYAALLIEKMREMPEHEIYADPPAEAKYYHILHMLYAAAGRKDLSAQMLIKAADIADQEEDDQEIYADIYSDLCAYISDDNLCIKLIKKALRIYESRQKSGDSYSYHSYAMALFNESILLMRNKELNSALQSAQKALLLWQKYELNHSNQDTENYIRETKRLIAHLKSQLI